MSSDILSRRLQDGRVALGPPPTTKQDGNMTNAGRSLLAILALASSPAWAIFTNGGFESGTFAGWTQSTYTNNGLSGSPPFTSANLQLTPNPAGHSFEGMIVGVTVDPQAPTLVLPRVGSFTAQVGTTMVGGYAESIVQQDA